MEITAILALVSQAIQVAIKVYPVAIKTAEDLRPFAEQLYKQFTGKTEVTAAEQKAIENLIDKLSAELQQPLPE